MKDFVLREGRIKKTSLNPSDVSLRSYNRILPPSTSRGLLSFSVNHTNFYVDFFSGYKKYFEFFCVRKSLSGFVSRRLVDGFSNEISLKAARLFYEFQWSGGWQLEM